MSILQNLRRHRRLVWHRLGDWVLVALMTGVAFLLDLAPAFNRQFSLTDTTIQYPMSKKSTVPSAALFVISTIVPALILTSIAVVHQALLGLGIALSSTSLFIHIFKNFIGRPRPDFLDRCQPPSDSFAGLGFLSFYIAGKLRIFDERGFVYKPLLALLPLLGAALVAISRVCDYRHHWEDVTLGGAAGMFNGAIHVSTRSESCSALLFLLRLPNVLPATHAF
ncbi:phosphatidic acid phosphatase type 2/haloperoxidase [Syncephalis plumigaleata]|nr:phosphatidic acid phosphatase type 2/haloperoxidase [Syncephalis plumigaleata]